MGSNVTSILRRFAQPNRAIEIAYEEAGVPRRCRGTLVEVTDDGVALLSDGVLRFIRSHLIQSFDLPTGPDASTVAGNRETAAPLPAKENLTRTPPDQVGAVAADSSFPTGPEAGVDVQVAPGNRFEDAPGSGVTASFETAFVLFSGPIATPTMEPDFSITGLKRDDQLELVRWKNRYEYALKIHEIARVRDDVPAIARCADSLRRGDLLALAGILAAKVGDSARSKDLLIRGAALQSEVALKALAYRFAEESEWESSGRYFGLCLLASPRPLTAADHDLLISCGRALTHVQNREVQGLSLLIDRASDEETRQLAVLLLAFALSIANPEASRLVLRGDVTGAQALLPTSPVFQRAMEPPPAANESPLPAGDQQPARVRVGKVTANYRDRGFGFLVDDGNAETYFFRIVDVTNGPLRASLEANRAGQRVEFMPQPSRSRGSGKYDVAVLARQLDEDASVTAGSVRTLLQEKRLAALPKGASIYARAKRAEQFDDLAKAEQWFRKEIEDKGPNWLSAIKDLSSLLSRTGRGDEAVALLEKHRSDFDNSRPVDNLLAHFYLKLSKFDLAAKIFRHLQDDADPRVRITLVRQEAFCAFAQGNFASALLLLEKLARQNPSDMQTLSLIERVKQARDSRSKGQAALDQSDVLDIEAFSSGLSPFAKALMDGCDFRGVDERSKARGFFDKKDFSDVDNLLSRVRGRRPRERADYSLTLAAMSVVAPDAAGDRRTHDLLRRYFTFMGEAAIYDDLHRDVARCYLAEAICYATEDTVETPLSLLVATYLQSMPSASELSAEIRIQNILPLFEKEKKSWEKFAVDFCYYSYLSVVATKRLDGDLKRNKALPNVLQPAAELERNRNKEAARLRKEYTQVRALHSSVIGAGTLQDSVTTLIDLADGTRFELDRQRLKTLSSLFSEAAVYWQEQDFVEKEAKNARLTSGLSAFLKEVHESPTKLSSEALQPLAKRLMDEAGKLFQEFQRIAKPELNLKNVLGEDYCILSSDGILPVSLELASKPGSAPVEGIEIVVLEEAGLALAGPAHSPEVLRGGQAREIRLALRPSEAQVLDRAFTLRAMVRYRTRSGEIGETPEQKIPVRLGTGQDVAPISNPYQSYSGGTIVDDPAMFFGRRQLLERVVDQLVSGPVGQCFVLYGQKRSGKSSILRQLERKINLPCLTVPITLGEMDVKDAETSFVRLCIDKLWERLSFDLGIEPPDWVDTKSIDRPLDAFKKAVGRTLSSLTKAGLKSPRIVLLVDEFTYLYEYIKEGIIPSTFMRHWKALLQIECFSAVVVGQDSMPKFKQAFANEFGVTHDERITYLSREEASELAETPILLDGKSRYRGKAVSRLCDLTAGSPFYLQITCDRLIRHLNRQKAVFATEADVEIAARELVFGEEALPIERFDPLITAAGESVAEASRETYLKLLNVIAHGSRQSGFARSTNIEGIPNVTRLLQDMSDREVVSLDSAGRVAIRVQLFAEWLRANCPLDAGGGK